MINQIKKTINYLIAYIKPRKFIYLSIDGVAPLAKNKNREIEDINQ